MYSTVSSNETSGTSEVTTSQEPTTINSEEQIYYDPGCEEEFEEPVFDEKGEKKIITEGDFLPYGCKLYYLNSTNFMRFKDLGVKRRILVLGVIGSFTPFCWNRHLFRVLRKARYYEERGIDYICCISTNDAYTQSAWGEYLGCGDSVFMLSDPKKTFTRRIGMDITVPWLDDNIRSRRYIIYAEDMKITKMIVAPDDKPNFKWECEHMQSEEAANDEDDSDSDAWV